jgi:rhomboid protease GluP
MEDGGREEAVLITSELLDERVDFERGMTAAPWPTLVLILVQVGLFGLELARGALEDPARLVALGALESGRIRAGEFWRLWSATLLHGGVDHLVGNVLALYATGMACEHAFGRLQFAGLYVAAGLCGSAAGACFLPPDVPGVGASGAIFGLMGASAAVILRHRARLHLRDKRIGWVLAAWIAYTLVLGFATPFVDNFAHLGGLVAGVLASFVLHPRVLDRRRPVRAWIFAAAAGLVVAAFTVDWVRHLLAPTAP